MSNRRVSESRIEIENVHPRLSADIASLRVVLDSVAIAEERRIESLSVVLTGHARVLSLNREYLQHDYHTDVLSFDLSEEAGGAIDGEIYVDLDTALERHAEFGAGFDAEVLRYAIHGLLHLIGYDDASDEGAAVMSELEDRYLKLFG